MMCLWTQRSVLVVAHGVGLARKDGASAWKVCRFEGVGSYRLTAPPPVTFLVSLSPQGKQVLFAREGNLYFYDFESPENPKKLPITEKILAMANLADGSLLGCLGEKSEMGDWRAVLRTAKFSDGQLRWGDILVVPPACQSSYQADRPGGERSPSASALGKKTKSKSSVKHAIIGEFAEPRKIHGELLWPQVTATTSAGGIALVSAESGVVTLVDAVLKRVVSAIRVWRDADSDGDGDEILAQVTPKGVLLALKNKHGDTHLLHLDAQGLLLSETGKVGRDVASVLGSSLLLSAGTCLISQSSKGLIQVELADMKTAPFSFLSAKGTILGTATDRGGSTHLLAIGESDVSARFVTLRSTDGGWQATDIEAPIFQEPLSLPPRLARSSAPASLVSLRTKGAGFWSARIGDTSEFEIAFANQGMEMAGLVVEVNGEAVDKEFITIQQAKVGKLEAPFVREGSVFRASLEALKVGGGFAKVFRGGEHAPDSTGKLKITMVGNRAGNPLLMVRLIPMAAVNRSGSLLQGKTISVG